ncbi:MAG TPA: hypothetical protein VGK80_05940 [Rhodanobacteraceae bacterium]
MNRTNGKIAAAASLALAICVAHAQQTPPGGTQDTPQGNMSAPQNAPDQNAPYQNQTPPAPPMGHPANPVSGASAATPDNRLNDAAATPFDSLDRSHQGYLTRGNAATDSWLASHFAQCDADRDGRVTRAEYTACSRAHP